MADEAWLKHLKKNRSVIVELFQGQKRALLICDNKECKHVSIGIPFSSQFSVSPHVCTYPHKSPLIAKIISSMYIVISVSPSVYMPIVSNQSCYWYVTAKF